MLVFCEFDIGGGHFGCKGNAEAGKLKGLCLEQSEGTVGNIVRMVSLWPFQLVLLYNLNLTL